MRKQARASRGAALAVAIAAGVGILLGSIGVASPEDSAGRTYVSERYDFSLSLPSGWRRAGDRLVPRLLMPREILSVGTAPMPVGQGGNCGREPRAAIGRMRPGDALVTIQEYDVTERMREHLADSFPPRARPLTVPRLEKSYAAPARGAPVLYATIPFSEAGRAFDALVYFRGRPSAARRAAVASILAAIRFGHRESPSGRATTAAPGARASRRIDAEALRDAIIRGAARDFRAGTGVGPNGFRRCLLEGLGRALDRAVLARLAAIARRPYGLARAAQALNELAVPIGDACGGRRYVPKLIAAATALDDGRPGGD